MQAVLKQSQPGRQQRGFTLIEALIAFMILSVGLLGIVSLLMVSKTSQHQAIQRSRAVILADDIVERIRINPAGMPTYNIGLNNPVGGKATPPSEPSPNCRTAACNSNELAAHDLWEWERALDGAGVTDEGGENVAGLINPRGCIVFTPARSGMTGTGLLNVLVQWRGLLESTDAVQTGEDVCGDASSAGDDPFRRQVRVNTYVIDEEDWRQP